MKHTRTLITALLLAVVLSGSTLSAAAEAEPHTEISLTSLLNEMVDRDALARYPQPGYRLRQFSSYDRDSKSPDDPKGWFANKDATKNFIRVEENQGRREWVIVEHEAPGVIVRSWMPDQRLAPGRKSPVTTVLRMYLDGTDTPAIEGNMLDLFNGTGPIPPPFAHPSLSSAVSFFPIPYARRCKITLDAPPFYYIFNCREYPAGTPMRTFSRTDFQAAAPQIKRVGQRLLEPALPATKPAVQWQGTLATNAEAVVRLAPGPGAVRQFTLKLAKYGEQVTRSLVLKIEFDGQPCVWCPVGDFFGTGLGLNPFQDWYRTVTADGTMTCRWVMPYRQSGIITLVNLHDQPVEAALSTTTGDWAWDERTMYFHTTWRHQYPVPTRPYLDWNYVTLTGRGVYVGDTLTVMNPTEKWWGEGDEKIWMDGEPFPSLFGTGTEDYYAYSWGGRNADFYQHPFHAQVRVGRNNSQTIESSARQSHTQGVSTETRTRALDAMTCSRSLQLDMEVWHWAECNMDYSVATYWYGFGDTTSNRAPAPAEAAAKVVQPPATAAGPFMHPGMLHSRAELAFIKKKITAGAEPWKTAWGELRASRPASLDYRPRPRAEVVRGPYNNPNIGSSELSIDSAAAYTHALQWSLTGNEAHARKTIEILNAWSATLKTVSGHDTKLLIGMEGVKLCNAAELLRHTYTGWLKPDQERFERLLREILYPPIKDFFPAANGNWDAAMIQTMLAMGIFLDDREMFQRAVDYYLKGEGNGAINKYFNAFGECQESGRDQAHTQMGLGFLGCAAEMAWKQGVDLYGASSNRLALGFEYTAKYNLGNDVPYEPYRSIDGKYLYRAISKDSRGRFAPIYERIVYHYHGRKGMEMPFSREVVAKGQSGGRSGGSHVPWGALMFAKMP